MHDIIKTIARSAGPLFMEGYTHAKSISYKSTVDLVTDYDVKVELFVKEKLSAAFPDYTLVGEETNEGITHPDKAIYIDAEILDSELQSRLIEGGYKGIILNANTLYDGLSDFFVAIGPSNIDSFDIAVLANASMDKIVLQSAYPEHAFEDIFTSVKQISSALFRPEESIIARATLHTLTLFGLK